MFEEIPANVSTRVSICLYLSWNFHGFKEFLSILTSCTTHADRYLFAKISDYIRAWIVVYRRRLLLTSFDAQANHAVMYVC